MTEVIFNRGALAEVLAGPTGPVMRHMQVRANRVLSGAKQRCNVDTGRLRSSLHMRGGRDARGPFFDVGSDVEYAIYVHEGTGYYVGNPFLTDALRAEF